MTLNGDDLRKVQLVQLKILKEVHRICEKHNIQYFLLGGTLIGAIRHKGFIPWDDDLDIGMLREEYEKFFVICQTELSDEYFFQTIDTDPGYGYVFGKIMLKGTVFIEAISAKAHKKSGIFIDIFPYDCIPKERHKRFIQLALARFTTRAYYLKKRYKIKRPISVKSHFRTFFAMLFYFFPSSVLYSLLYHTITKYSHLAKNNEGMVTKFAGKRDIVDINNLRIVTLGAFEDGMFYIPKNYDIVLSNYLGDYMTLPPPEKRIPSHELIEYKL